MDGVVRVLFISSHWLSGMPGSLFPPTLAAAESGHHGQIAEILTLLWSLHWVPWLQPPLSTALSNFCSQPGESGISALTDSKPAITKCYDSAILRPKEAFSAFLLGRNRLQQLVIFLFFFPSELNLWVRIQVSAGKSTVSAGGTPAAAHGPQGFHWGRADSKPCTDRARAPHKMNFHHSEICLRSYRKKHPATWKTKKHEKWKTIYLLLFVPLVCQSRHCHPHKPFFFFLPPIGK